jgi:uncharacterized protein
MGGITVQNMKMTGMGFKSGTKIWVLLDDRAGNRSQCLGVADALGLPYEAKELSYSWMGRLPNTLLGASFLGITGESRSALNAPWPDLIIAAGRRTAPVARKIKRLSSGNTALAQVMWPGEQGSDEFELIAVPQHDDVDDKINVFKMMGSPHKVTDDVLYRLRDTWSARLSDVPKPHFALIVGGSTKNKKFTPSMARELGCLASEMANNANGGLLVSTSRRTGDATDTLINSISAPAKVFRWGDEGENPYPGFLACADTIIVTGESMSMCSEACSGQGPVYIYAPDALITAKHKRLHLQLYDGGYARPLGSGLETWTHPPLNSANEVADAIRELLQSRTSNA